MRGIATVSLNHNIMHYYESAFLAWMKKWCGDQQRQQQQQQEEEVQLLYVGCGQQAESSSNLSEKDKP